MSPTYRSFAKINLHLQVVGRRDDGYHELRTVFQTVDLCDLVEVEPQPAGVDLEVLEGEAPGGRENLAVRAAEAFLARWGGDGVRVGLRKRIPVGGGLGGGSSDAATVLLALAERLGEAAPGPRELWPVARELGADVPYFLVGGTALGVGRGDEVLPLPELEQREVWLVTPPVQVPTAAVFGALGDLTPRPAPPSILALAQGIGPRTLEALAGWNDLEEAVFARFPAVHRGYNALLEAGASLVRLSGSGATLFACFPEASSGVPLGLLPAGTSVVRARTVPRSEIARRRSVDRAIPV